jgi:tRNA(Ile)-lysidine synthase
MDGLRANISRDPLLSRWVRHIERSIVARKLLRDSQKVLVAVSGGLDSTVLLHVLHLLSAARRWKLTVAHFNHQLRGRAADADEQLVRRTSRRMGLRFVCGRANVAAHAKAQGISTEMAGRKLRHDFFARTARRLGIPTIALAHHADDQVELFFLRLLRGTSSQGLAGMRWRNPSPSDPSVSLVRPLLDQSKAELLTAAQAVGAQFSEDSTNSSLDIHRNRARHELLPLLRAHYQPQLSERVLRLIELTGAESDVITGLAEQWLAAKRRRKFHRLPKAIQRRVIHLQLPGLSLSPDFELVERLRENIDQPMTVAPGRCVWRDAAGMLHQGKVEKAKFRRAQMKIDLTAGAGGSVQFGSLALRWEIVSVTGDKLDQKPDFECFDADKIGNNITLRHWRPGDCFQPIGMKSSQKLQDIFTDLKVPREERHQCVVAVTRRDELFWVEGLRMSERFKLEAKTRNRLNWQWKRWSD